jgi:hypothetical protein
VQDVIYKYTNHYQDSFKEWLPQDRPGDNIVKLNKVSVIDSEKNQIFQPETGQTFGVCIEFEVLENNVKPAPNFHFYDSTEIYCL